MFLVMSLLSRYMIPTKDLIKLYEGWLLRKKESDKSFQKLDYLIKLVLANFKIMSGLSPPEKGLYVCWPPSAAEIHALDICKPIKVKVVYPNGESREYEVDEATTVESLMREKIFTHDKLFKGHTESQFYWLYSQ